MPNQFTFNHIIQKVYYRLDTVKYIRFIYDIYELLKVCKKCGNFVVALTGCGFVFGPCFHILFLMPFLVQQSSCQERELVASL